MTLRVRPLPSKSGFFFIKIVSYATNVDMNQYLRDFVETTFHAAGKALDLGAGDFGDVNGLRHLGWECDGVDLKDGVDLEKPYTSTNAPCDLVYSNYVLHKLQKRHQLIQTIFDNLKEDGWFFIHTFDTSDTNSTSDLSRDVLNGLLTEQGFKNIKIRLFDFFDDEEGHKHWHKILEAIGQKPPEGSSTLQESGQNN
ncbi:MAG: methyltransferase domain-containing protein [Patescibacteria group bacterium]